VNRLHDDSSNVIVSAAEVLTLVQIQLRLL